MNEEDLKGLREILNDPNASDEVKETVRKLLEDNVKRWERLSDEAVKILRP